MNLGRADRRETVDLVEEDDARLLVASPFKEQSELAFGLTNPLGQAVRALTHEER